MEVEDENDINWEDLAGGWSSVRSPQWLRSKWWSIKRQVTNHKEIPFSGTHDLMLTVRFFLKICCLLKCLKIDCFFHCFSFT